MNQDRLRYIITPSWLQSVVCLTVGLGILTYSLSDQVIAWLAGSAQLNLDTLKLSLHNQLTGLSQVAGIRIGFIGLFWVGVAILIYGTYLSFRNIETELENELAAVETGGISRRWWYDRLLQLGASAILILLVVATQRLFLPVWLDLAAQTWFSKLSVVTTGGGILALIGISINLYAIWTFGQLVLYLPQLRDPA